MPFLNSGMPFLRTRIKAVVQKFKNNVHSEHINSIIKKKKNREGL